MTELSSRGQNVDDVTLQRQQATLASFEANRGGVQMIGRNIFQALGTNLVRRFTVDDPVHQGTQRSPLDTIHTYAIPTMALATVLGWGEDTPAFRLLSTQIFLSSADTLQKKFGAQRQYQELSEEVQRKMKLYRDATGISDQDQERVQLITKYLGLTQRQQFRLFTLLEEGNIDAFFQKLRGKPPKPDKEDTQDPQIRGDAAGSEAENTSNPFITTVEIGKGRRMFQTDREALVNWLREVTNKS